MMEENKPETQKEIEIINGDGKNLDISPVYDHIKINKPSQSKDKDKEIIVPKSKKDEQNK